MAQSVLCLGFGYCARWFSRLLPQEVTVFGTTRSAERAQAIAATGIEPLLWTPDSAPEFPSDVSAVLVSTPPTGAGCPAFRAFSKSISERADEIRWIGYLSTNGVYGDHDGAWVDETSFLYPSSDRARHRIAAEAQWAELGVAHARSVVIFRLPGIYGPGRSALDSVREGRARRIFKDGQVFSRAHVADIAKALLASYDRPEAGSLFNIADDEPAPPQDVISYACQLLGAPEPPLIPLESAELSAMAASFYADNKRANNTKMKEALGVSLAYPTYREGLSAIFNDETRNA